MQSLTKKNLRYVYIPRGLLHQGPNGQFAFTLSHLFSAASPHHPTVSHSLSLSLGSFGSHWAVEPLSPVGRHSLLPAHCCPCRAHRAGTSTLSYTKGTTSLHSEEQLQTSRSEYYEAWEPGGAPGLV